MSGRVYKHFLPWSIHHGVSRQIWFPPCPRREAYLTQVTKMLETRYYSFRVIGRLWKLSYMVFNLCLWYTTTPNQYQSLSCSYRSWQLQHFIFFEKLRSNRKNYGNAKHLSLAEIASAGKTLIRSGVSMLHLLVEIVRNDSLTYLWQQLEDPNMTECAMDHGIRNLICDETRIT